MADFWFRVRSLQGQELRTYRGLAFTVDAVTDTWIRVIPSSTGFPRTIERERIERAYARKRTGERLKPSTIQAEGISAFNSAYVAAIVNHLSP